MRIFKLSKCLVLLSTIGFFSASAADFQKVKIKIVPFQRPGYPGKEVSSVKYNGTGEIDWKAFGPDLLPANELVEDKLDKLSIDKALECQLKISVYDNSGEVGTRLIYDVKDCKDATP